MDKEQKRKYDRQYYILHRTEILNRIKRGKEEKKKYNHQYYLLHKAKLFAYRSLYRAKNKDKISQRRKKYYLDHKQKELSSKKEYYYKNLEKCRATSKKWKQSHKKEVHEYRKEYYLENKKDERIKHNIWRNINKKNVKNDNLKRYGITFNDFENLKKIQNNRCGICKNIFKEVYPFWASVDHAHNKSKTIRGLLCQKCNSAIGLFNDDVILLNSAIRWLEGNKIIYNRSLEKNNNYHISKKYYQNIKLKYDLPKEVFDKMLEESNNRCGLCNKTFNYNLPDKATVDHCHKTNKIRGLLCFRCNSAMGLFKDDVDLIKEAIYWIKGAKHENG